MAVVAADHLEERGPQSDLGGVPPALAPPPGHPRFAHIDGVRAIAALCVLVFNAVANGLIRSSTPFEEVYVQPAPGDSGTAVGAAYHGLQRALETAADGGDGSYLHRSRLRP